MAFASLEIHSATFLSLLLDKKDAFFLLKTPFGPNPVTLVYIAPDA
jgi:hypothetical protein